MVGGAGKMGAPKQAISPPPQDPSCFGVQQMPGFPQSGGGRFWGWGGHSQIPGCVPPFPDADPRVCVSPHRLPEHSGTTGETPPPGPHRTLVMLEPTPTPPDPPPGAPQIPTRPPQPPEHEEGGPGRPPQDAEATQMELSPAPTISKSLFLGGVPLILGGLLNWGGLLSLGEVSQLGGVSR